MQALKIKKWCDENITPMAWQRIVIKNLDIFKTKGWGITEMNNPDESINLDAKMTEALKATIKELYQVEIPEAVLV
jgi:hypothetical protein